MESKIMKRNYTSWLLIPIATLLASCSGEPPVKSIQAEAQVQAGEVANSEPLAYVNYAVVLDEYVNDEGWVDYQALKQNRQKLDAFNATLAAVSPARYQGWSETEQIAFWLNAYNSLTLEAIIDNYPTDSIRDIPGVWKRLQFTVVGQDMTLDEIEHATLRKVYNEPRIHMALVCASISCPKLRDEPYTGEQLDAQLDDQTREFLSHPRNFKIDRQAGTVYLSSIFKWFGEDWEKTYGGNEKFSKFNDKEGAVLNFVSQYLNESDRQYLQQGDYPIDYLDYDWSLNES
jgi:hypothetical protein